MASPILSARPLGFVWDTADPFLFCVHHDDAYPAGNDDLGPAASLAGRNLGQDFALKDGWRMYHGSVVPGFPQHPHRGFETVTLVRRGLIDHSDSLGAAARFGRGDAQWLTAGAGVVHAEMFPLLDRAGPNHLELFQIWLNLPGVDKMAPAHFTMLWGEDIPRVERFDPAGRKTVVTVVAGRLGTATPLPPPPRSWAARPESDLAIWTIGMEPGACWTLPPAQTGTNRTLYVFRGGPVSVAGTSASVRTGLQLQPEEAVSIESGGVATELVLLQGRPIGEPVAAHGPFVMNTVEEIHQAYADYRRTRFGGWPWPDDAPTHARGEGRFARHADGRVERKSG